MKLNKIGYFVFFIITPFLLWVIWQPVINRITFISLLIIMIITKYLPKVQPFHNTLEIIVLFLGLEYLFNELGLNCLFPLNHVFTLFILYLFLLRMKKVTTGLLRLKKGEIKNHLVISLVFVFFSVAGLSLWFILQKNNPYAELLPSLPIPLLFLMGIGFAIINGIYEESIFRSILFTHFFEAVGYLPAMFLQAIWFSFLHYKSGFPSGSLGIILTFSFGIMMGYLLYRSKGIFLPIVVHTTADFVVFILVVMRVNGLV